MILENDIRQQLQEYLALMEGDVVLTVSAGEDETSRDMLALVEELAGISSRIRLAHGTLDRTPAFSVGRPGEQARVTFAGIPLGHEFTSLVLALLQVSGRPPKAEAALIERIRGLQGEHRFETFVSLTCHNCPEVVQALNLMAVLNPGVRHVMLDGAVWKDEAETRGVMAVPAVFLDGEFLEGGRMNADDLLDLLAKRKGAATVPETADAGAAAGGMPERDPFDVLVVGGGPAGASAAIYAARKGIRTGLVADRFGGQVLDTLGIENYVGIPYTEGPKVAASLREHVGRYPVDIIERQRAGAVRKDVEYVEVELESGATLRSRTVVLALGARWRNIGVPGEAEFRNKGVAYCPHCDGPLFAGRDVAVVGGGNSGIEAAIDLAGICRSVTVLEFLPELKADAVLQERLGRLSNVTVHRNVQTKEIYGNSRVEGIAFVDRATGEAHRTPLAGVFVQIGLVPNTEWIGATLERNRMGEIVVDRRGATSLPGVFAAGDCTDVPFKQIVISMGSGATAALGAFEHLIRS